jgi:hypothetical protein
VQEEVAARGIEVIKDQHMIVEAARNVKSRI